VRGVLATGGAIGTPITESHPAGSINAYGATKLAIERALPHCDCHRKATA